jgi:hypothetical protein
MLARQDDAPPPLRVVAADPPPSICSREQMPLVEPVHCRSIVAADGSVTVAAFLFAAGDIAPCGKLVGCGRCPAGRCDAERADGTGLYLCLKRVAGEWDAVEIAYTRFDYP